ncbi:MAG: LptF/LptG family permease [Candidatus Krumholzibacteriota bacterium]|nr:LptF/LptG family permease [Candidatus Krumholzibacteriota bacterium]
MKINDRYILTTFWHNIYVGLIAFVAIYLTVDVSEKVDKFIDGDSTILQAISYYFFQLPWIVMLITPVAVLLATVFTLGKLSRDNELTAFIASGIPLIRISRAIFISALLITVLSTVLSDILVPVSKRKAEEIMDIEIVKTKKRSSLRYKHDLHYQGENNRTYYAERYDVSMSMMVNIIVQEYEGSNLVRRIDAKKAFWNGTKWIFVDGAVRIFKEAGGEDVTPFTRLEIVDFPERPEDFAKNAIEPEEMNFTELRDYIEKVRRGGGSVDKYMVDLYFKFSFPFTSFIFAIIGVALSSAKRKASMSTGFGLTLLISFTYYGILRIGQALGHSGVIPPPIAAWFGNIIFFLIGGLFLRRSNQ